MTTRLILHHAAMNAVPQSVHFQCHLL